MLPSKLGEVAQDEEMLLMMIEVDEACVDGAGGEMDEMVKKGKEVVSIPDICLVQIFELQIQLEECKNELIVNLI